MTKPQPARRESDNEPSLGPEEVRDLRGSLSRADFARKVGVTPLTVYRWELPEDAAQSRRPRGAVAERLRRVIAEAARASRPSASGAHALPSSPSAHAAHATAGASGGAGGTSRQNELAPEDAAAVLPAIDRILRAELARAEDDLVQLLVSGQLVSNAGRAMAQAALALGQMIARNDGRSGFVTLQPALREADAGTLPPTVEILVRTAASLVFSSADGRLYDMGRVNAQLARALPLVTGDTSPDLLFLLHIGAAVGTLLGGFAGREAGRAARAALLDRMEAVTEPVTRLIADEMRAHFMIFGGQTAQATPRLLEVVAHAAELGIPVVESRALGFLALRYTDEVGDPERILEVVNRARDVAARGRVAVGLHSVFGPKTMAEAYLRMGRFEEAERALAEGLVNAASMSWSPVALVMPLARLARYTGRPERILSVAEELERRPGTPGAIARLLVAAEELASGRKTDALHLAEQHFEQNEPNPFLMEDVFLWGVTSRLAHEDVAETKLAVRRLQRLLDRFPSVVMSAVLKRSIALLACREGRFSEALPMLETAIATSELAHDVTEAAMSRHWLAKVAYELERPGSEALIEESEKECAELGLVPFPQHLEFGTFDPNAPASTAAFSTRVAPRSEGLAVAVERLSVRGTSASMLRRELVAVTSELFPGRLVVLDEIGAHGEARRIETRDDTNAPRVVRRDPTADGDLGFEFGDGLGSRLRLAIGGALPDGAHDVLRLLTTVTSLSLEVSALRGFSDDKAPAHDAEATEVPGLVAASAAMRRLRAEISRLGGSRATVIVQGESGTGKEIVARAIHDLSARAKGPYVTFNCAAVPRELFEGQLFGYRRGAFTGAVADHPGVIRAASGGTLFLDEIGELPLEVQPKLLRFLENREVMPLGESRAIEVDVRTIAATHQDLARRVHEGKFREDLYYRLQVVPLMIPPLRERPEDVVAIARHFVRRMTPADVEPPVLAPDALARLVAHPWPGNVRELRNVIERSLAFTPLPRALTAAHLRIGPSTIRPPK